MCHFRVSSHCCQVHTDSWPPASVWPSIAKLLTLRHSAMGPCTASSCCCQVQSVSWVPVRPPIAADFIASQTLPCATFRSPYTVGRFHFVIGCYMAFHCCCLHRHPAPCAS
ncbi:unnamed protein product, partial [Staurois parvus]